MGCVGFIPVFGKVEPGQEGGQIFVRDDSNEHGSVRNDVHEGARYVHFHVQLVRVQLIAGKRDNTCSEKRRGEELFNFSY